MRYDVIGQTYQDVIARLRAKLERQEARVASTRKELEVFLELEEKSRPKGRK